MGKMGDAESAFGSVQNAPRRRFVRAPQSPSMRVVRTIRVWFMPIMITLLTVWVARNWVWLVEIAGELKQWEAEARR